MGVSAEIDGHAVMVGNSKFLEEYIAKDPESGDVIQRLRSEAKTTVLVAIDGALVGVIGIADEVKPDSHEAVSELQKMNLAVAMLTGDNKATALEIARKVNIIEVISDVLPEGKNEEIKKIQQQDRHVIMVGDGINDAPALAQADVGMAIGTGTEVAIASAGITLISGSLKSVARAVKLSRMTLRVIIQ